MRRIGVATFATLCSQIAGSLVGYVALGHQHPSRMDVPQAGFIAWMTWAFVTGVMLCVLAVVYLRYVFRDNAAPRNRVLWTLLIILLGPFAMVYYWTVYMRRLPQGMV